LLPKIEYPNLIRVVLDEKLSGEIKTLHEKVTGIDKRLDNQEFINRGVVGAVLETVIGGAAKLFGFLPNVKP
jgi:hypothetical protein